MEKEGKTSSMFMLLFLFTGISLVIASLWNNLPFIKEAVNYILNPTIGTIIKWNITFGSLIVFFVLALISTLVQKYATDQKSIRELKKEQDELKKEIKKFEHDKDKMLELQKDLFSMTPKFFELTMKGNMFTIIPFILTIRWFIDFYTTLGNPTFFGFLNWFWFYFIALFIFTLILRSKKILDVA